MRKRILLIGLLLLSGMAMGQKVKHITIAHTNDTHSAILPVNFNGSDTLHADKGGFLRRLALIRELRKADKQLLLFDSGDFSQGSLYYTLFKGKVEVELMNRMGYTAAAIGNHEFDGGLENMAQLFRRANFPLVCANYHFEGTPVEGLVKPYIIVRRRGVKIGIFGLSPQLEGVVSQSLCQGVVYESPIVVANRMGTLLRDLEGCDYVICLSHLGWDGAVENDQVVMAHSRNIDLFLGGHTHHYFEEPVRVENLDGLAIPNYQMGKHGQYVGVVELQFTRNRRSR